MTISRIALALAALVAMLAHGAPAAAGRLGIMPPDRVQISSGPWTYYEYNDQHIHGPYTGAAGLARMKAFVDLVNADSLAAFVLFCGDFVFDQYQSPANLATEAWGLQLVLDRLEIPFLFIPGNHENETISFGVFNSTSTLLNRFVRVTRSRLFTEWESPTDRGHRWNFFRPRARFTGRPLNALVFVGNNCAQDTTADDLVQYEDNNPDDGGGVTAEDFDGIDAPNSFQNRAFDDFLDSLRPGDWPIVGFHRATVAIVDSLLYEIGGSSRPPYRRALDQDGYATRLAATGVHGLLYEGDTHAIYAVDRGTHHVFSSTQTGALRSLDASRITRLGSSLLCYVGSDVAGGSQGILDSLGVNVDVQPKLDANGDYDAGGSWDSWQTVWKVAVSGGTSTHRLLMIQNHGEAAFVLHQFDVEL